MSDNEHAAAALWNSEELSVKHSVGEAIPEFDHAPENGTKVPSSIRRQDAGHVLPNQPPGPFAVSQPKIFERQVTAVVIQAAAAAGEAEGLAGGSADKKVNWPIVVGSNRREIAVARHVGIMVCQNGAGERLDFAERGRRPSERMPGDGCGFNARADGEIPHNRPSNSATSAAICGSNSRSASITRTA